MNKHQQEYIGKTIKIIKSTNKNQDGITGTIIDETKNTFTIQSQTKEIKITKNGKTFEINNQKINGDTITKRPEERIKIKAK